MGKGGRPKKRPHGRKSEGSKALPDRVVLDLNNILTVMLGYTELALAFVPPDSDAQRHLQEVLMAGKRAKELIEQASSFPRQMGE
ncbi:MAG: hypothetical protein KatS3mg131_3192 [Candidatus Tectimicrobiota bacterium]|nr:MAG: hypothetical protein KatS3mg131_3192 [Candidatus Tectomicrobia bacterium]